MGYLYVAKCTRPPSAHLRSPTSKGREGDERMTKKFGPALPLLFKMHGIWSVISQESH